MTMVDRCCGLRRHCLPSGCRHPRSRRWSLLALLASLLLLVWSCAMADLSGWSSSSSSSVVVAVTSDIRSSPLQQRSESMVGQTPRWPLPYQESSVAASHLFSFDGCAAAAPLPFAHDVASSAISCRNMPQQHQQGDDGHRQGSAIRFEAVSWSSFARWRGTVHVEATASASAAAIAMPSSVSIRLERDALVVSQLRREAIDEDEVPWAPLALSAAWASQMRHVGPDAFYGVLVGPELVAMSSRRCSRKHCAVASQGRGGGVSEEGIRQYQQSPDAAAGTAAGPQPSLEVVSYELLASVNTAGPYVVHLQHQFYNNGGFHDRDRYAAPYEPHMIIGKRNAAGRAGSVKLSRQRLAIQPVDRNDAGGAGTPRPQHRDHFTITVPPTGRRLNVTALSLSDDEDQVAQLPACTAAFVQERSLQGDQNALRGRYIQLQLPHEAAYNVSRQGRLHEQLQSIGSTVSIRGWTTDTAYPINGRQYLWDGDLCRIESYVQAANSTESGKDAIPGQHEGKLASCLARRKLKVLFLGDSQVRTLFHTALSVVTMRKAVVGKTHYGRYIAAVARRGSDEEEVVGGSSPTPSAAEGCWPQSWSETVEAAASCYGHRYSTDPAAASNRSHRHAALAGADSYLEFIWDPLMLNLSSHSQLQTRRNHRASALDAQRALLRKTFPKSSNEDDDHTVDHDRHQRPLPDSIAMEEAEDADKRLPQLDDDYARYGPDAYVAHDAAYEGQKPKGAAMGGSEAHPARHPGSSQLVADAVVQSDVLVIGFGGWFGIYIWEMADVEAHLVDVVDALRVLGERRIRSGTSKKQRILLVATPAWPSYVAWEGHRRNTNYRLGAIAQLTRRVFAANAAANAAFDLVVDLPYFEMSYPVSHMRLHEKDIHYDRSMVPYGLMNLIGSLICLDG